MTAVNDIKKLFKEIKETSFDETDYESFNEEQWSQDEAGGNEHPGQSEGPLDDTDREGDDTDREGDDTDREGDDTDREGDAKTSINSGELHSGEPKRGQAKAPRIDSKDSQDSDTKLHKAGFEPGALSSGAKNPEKSPHKRPEALPPSEAEPPREARAEREPDGRPLLIRVLAILSGRGESERALDHMSGADILRARENGGGPQAGDESLKASSRDQAGVEPQQKKITSQNDGEEGAAANKKGAEPSLKDGASLENKDKRRSYGKRAAEQAGAKENNIEKLHFLRHESWWSGLIRGRAFSFFEANENPGEPSRIFGDEGDVDFILFREQNQKISLKILGVFKGVFRALGEFFLGIVDGIEVLSRYIIAFLLAASSLFLVGLIVATIFFRIRRRGTSRLAAPGRLLSLAFEIATRPFLDGRIFLAVGVASSLLMPFLSRHLMDRQAIILIAFSLGSIALWPLFRAVYLIHSGSPFRGRYVGRGAPAKFMLEKRAAEVPGEKPFIRHNKAIRPELAWAYKNRGWIDTSALDPKATAKLDREFELITAKTLWLLGFSAEHTGKSKDGGKDVIVRDSKGRTIFVSCKRFNSEVGPAYVRDLFGLVSAERAASKGEKLGLLVTTVGFGPGAKKFAEENGILLATLDELIEAVKI